MFCGDTCRTSRPILASGDGLLLDRPAPRRPEQQPPEEGQLEALLNVLDDEKRF